MRTMTTSILYEKDFYAWTQEQVSLMKRNIWDKMDIVHLEEELESMGASEQRSLESKLTQLIMHMLKLKYQHDYVNTKSWIRSIKFQRNDIRRILLKNPSFNAKLTEVIADIYENAVLMAADETNLDETVFPVLCEWSAEQILSVAFFPV